MTIASTDNITLLAGDIVILTAPLCLDAAGTHGLLVNAPSLKGDSVTELCLVFESGNYLYFQPDMPVTKTGQDDAQREYQKIIADGASCAALSIPCVGTEPQWTDVGINLDNLLEIAQCLWEIAAEASDGPLEAFRSKNGAAELRSFLRDLPVLLACDEGWKIAQREADFDDSFDWEFCPWFLRTCIEFSDGAIALCADWRDRCASMAS